VNVPELLQRVATRVPVAEGTRTAPVWGPLYEGLLSQSVQRTGKASVPDLLDGLADYADWLGDVGSPDLLERTDELIYGQRYLSLVVLELKQLLVGEAHRRYANVLELHVEPVDLSGAGENPERERLTLSHALTATAIELRRLAQELRGKAL
jgi:hypothetical protein